MTALPNGRGRHQHKNYESEAIRPLARQLIARLMDGFCGCCGQPSTRLWCDRCAGHVGTRGKLCERTYLAVKAKPCPFQV